MKATFCIELKLDYPDIKEKHKMMAVMNTLVGDIQELLDEDVTDVNLLNHTLTFAD
jgi:hypothetical protein